MDAFTCFLSCLRYCLSLLAPALPIENVFKDFGRLFNFGRVFVDDICNACSVVGSLLND